MEPIPVLCDRSGTSPVAVRQNNDLNQLRRRLRGLPHPTLLKTLQAQLETFEVATLAADNTGRYIAANTRASELTGYSHAELMKLSVTDLTPLMRHALSADLWNRFIQAGTQTGEYVLQRKDGSPLGVQYSAYASVAPGVHISFLTPLELPTSL